MKKGYKEFSFLDEYKRKYPITTAYYILRAKLLIKGEILLYKLSQKFSYIKKAKK